MLQTHLTEDKTEVGVLFVPDRSRAFLQQRMTAYGAAPPSGGTRPFIAEFEVVEAIRAAGAESLFVGRDSFETVQAIWWEFWILRDGMAHVLAMAQRQRVDVHRSKLLFPDIGIVFVHATSAQVCSLVSDASGQVAEIRKATATPDVMLDNNRAVGQADWVDDLVLRTVPPTEDAPAVCIHDTGIAAAHPLIEPGLRRALAYDDAWGTGDDAPWGGHGTPMGGLVLHDDLFYQFQGRGPHPLTHWLESVKILPPGGFPPTEPANYGDITVGAIAKIEVEDPSRARAHCLAITDDAFDPSRPSTWSGAIDQACAGSTAGDDDDGPRRLFFIASGNTADDGKIDDVLVLRALEDPAQAWNAVTVGGYTAKDAIHPPNSGLRPAVKANNRSPYSRGSVGFDRSLMPFKPEVVFEAGNMAVDRSDDCRSHESLSLISTGSSPLSKPLVPFWATSAATAVAGNFFGQLMAALPNRWEETYRALMVHSAEWTVPMRKRMRAFSNRKTNHPLLREFGFGVPNIDRALRSGRNDVTLMAETAIQPFGLSADRTRAVFKDIHYYRLPWPSSVLQQIENEIVDLRITLSYFPEPNLNPRAATRPETYRSYGLRFKLKRSDETEDHFRQRINKSEREAGASFGSDGLAGNWLVGPGSVSAGSLHCDIWRGRAIDLAAMDMIAVYPVTGWWKTHIGQRKAEAVGRYALLVSIDARGREVDLYSEIVNSLAIDVPIGV